MKYAFVHHGTAYTPDGTHVDPHHVEAHNAQIEAIVEAIWHGQPDHMVAYYDTRNQTITTWRGTVLGRITSSHVYRHNFGGRFISLSVVGTNGARYHGRGSYDGGSSVRLHRTRR